MNGAQAGAVALTVSLIGACGPSSVSPPVSLDDARVMNLEHSIKDKGEWPKEVTAVRPLRDVKSVIVGELQTAGGIARAADGFIRLLDNSSGALFTLDTGLALGGPDAIHETGLEHPTVMRTFGGITYAADDIGIRTLAPSGTPTATVRSYNIVHDFAALDDGTFLISATSPAVRAPVVQQIDRTGRVRRVWGVETSPGAAGAFLWRDGALAVCHDRVYVARRHRPVMNVFSLTGEPDKELALPMRGRDELLRLYDSSDVVNPEPGRYRLPRFADACKCVGETPYVLLAFQTRLALARVHRDGSSQVYESPLGDGVQMLWRDMLLETDDTAPGRLRVHALGLDAKSYRWRIVHAVVES